MGVLTTGVAVVSSTALPQQTAAAANARLDGGLAQNVATTNAVVSGQAAAVVTLSGAPSQRRGATHSENRMVDGTFDGHESKSEKKEVSKKKGRRGHVDVVA